MTLSKDEMHVYLRHIDEGERTSLSTLVGKIGPGARVLDVGCGSGALGQYLSVQKQCVVDGVTFNEAEAALARAHYRHVEVANLEQTALSSLFGANRYDFIVCADILEHLREPQKMLRDMQSLLTEQGQLLISIPNSTYAGLVAELMQGEFLYRQEGLLDATHVRHFTRKSLLRMLQDCGWQVESFETIERHLQESEFKLQFDLLPPAVARHLLAGEDALTYQFIVAAAVHAAASEPVDNSRFLSQRPADAAPAQAMYSSQLYWDDGQGYSEEHKRVVPGAIGAARQTLRFDLPSDLSGLVQLKFDPADRAGILYLYRLSVLNADGIVWQWQVEQDGAGALLRLAATHQMAWGGALLGGAPVAPALLTGDDPWIKLPIEAAQLQQALLAGPVSVEVELGWPMSADYISLLHTVGPMQAEQQYLREQSAAQVRRIAEVSQDHEKLALEHAELHRLHAELHRSHAELHQETRAKIDALQLENRYLFSDREQVQTQSQAQVADLQQQLRGMADHLSNMRNSRVFRYTRPLVHLRDVVKGRVKFASGPTSPAAPAATDAVSPTADGLPDSQMHSMPVAIPEPMSDTVDIIVPVYKGLADTQLCVDSVLASEVGVPYRLIVINDCSPEPEVTEWLRKRAAHEPRIILLENEENLGFVGTVNRGMRHSDAHDVLLLNSDTEVANDWLARLRNAAYRLAKVGSVTPFSSNATICSYPVFCKANPLPEGYSTAQMDALFAQTNPGQSVEVPTGVGFCMYIRRDCLQVVGLFDEESFGKGYGEENDFCQRALQQGWPNLHALDTYVLHTAGVSFGESKSAREQAAMETLRRMHPSYESQVHAFLQRDPAKEARLAVDWQRWTAQGTRPVILAIHHQRGGGTEQHVLELAHTLKDQAVFLSLRPISGHQVLLQVIEHDTKTQRSQLSGSWSVVFDTVHERAKLLQLLQDMGVCHVHYHHLLGHDKLAWELPQLLGVGYDFTTHDFYSFCTNITMTGRKGHYDVDAHTGECCAGVHPTPIPPVEESIQDWRIRNRMLLEGARFVLAPGLDAAERIHAFAPEAKLRFAPHTDIDVDTLPAPQPRVLAPQQPLRIAVLGAISVIKGADVLEQAAQLAKKQGLPLEFHLIGFAYRHLQTAPATALKVHGQYDERDLPAILQRIAPDLIWLPAQWPETYSYTLSAALQAGLPVAVPDIGAFAARVAGRAWSWVLPWNASAQQWLDAFMQMREQHFEAGTSPQPPEMPAQLGQREQAWGGWSYADDYLPVLPTREAQAQAQATAAHAVAHLFAIAEPRSVTQQAVDGLRGQVLQQLVRLRSMPVMRSVVQAIPPQVQSRVKSWLQR
ncbi:methyltransferase domain-containing protein [Lampropedia aestuarii]|uniref:methyltransferase domain-containing protein n=1 Tax=Lampropedia aestuarii TaxID=2562762 RepID=UPI0024682B1C|nr:methyltransferase domain-containing protein [Lampropedia aestuarii]MDH5857519.1 methyltransferase domain-containing protein [Lampropedia aestuarii]